MSATSNASKVAERRFTWPQVGKAVLVAVLLKTLALCILYIHFVRTDLKTAELGFVFVPAGSSRAERETEIRRSFVHRLTPYDGQWYLDIAARGYRYFSREERLDGRVAEGNFAFFPLLPGILRLLSQASSSAGVALGLLAVLSLGCAALCVVSLLARDLSISPLLPAVLLAAFPSAVFQLVLYTEGPFLLLSALTLLCSRRGHALEAAGLGVLCGLCRPQGILLAAPVAWDLLLPALRAGERRPRVVAARLGATVAPGLGFLAMGAVSWHVTGSPTGFLGIQTSWGRSFGLGGPLTAMASALGYAGPPLDAFAFGIGVVLLPIVWTRLPRSLALYGTLILVFPLLTGSLLSVGRFVSVSIPHFLALAIVLRSSRWAACSVVLLFGILQVLAGKGLIGWFFVG